MKTSVHHAPTRLPLAHPVRLGVRTRARILDLLDAHHPTGGLSGEAVARELKMAAGGVRQQLRRLARDGEAVPRGRTRTRRWLPTDPPEPDDRRQPP